MKNFEERCAELGITLIAPEIQKLNPGKGRPPKNHFFKYVSLGSRQFGNLQKVATSGNLFNSNSDLSLILNYQSLHNLCAGCVSFRLR